MMLNKYGMVVLGLVLQLFAVSLAEAAAGRFQFVVGDVRVTDPAGKERAVRKGDAVNEGDSILSGASGTAQILLVDGGILAVRPDTRMKIDEYKFNGKDDGSERSFFSIVKGGFRAITGLIGKRNKENYGIRTPAATIGIRGTDSETVHVVAPLPNVPEGTYNKVNTGATVMNGTVINPNQVGYTPNLQTPAAILPAMPPIFEAAKPSQGEKKDDKDNGEKKDQQQTEDKKGQQKGGDKTGGQGGQGTGNGSKPKDNAIGLVTNPVPVPPIDIGKAERDIVGPQTAVDAPIGSGGVGSEISYRTECVDSPSCTTQYTGWWSGAGNMVREAGKTQTMLLNPATGMPVLLAEKDGTDDFQYLAGTATVQGYGQTNIGDVKIAWGRYVGADTMVDKDGVNKDLLAMNMAWTNAALNYGQAYALVNAGATYNFTANLGGSITDELGNAYSVISNSLVVNNINDVKFNISVSAPGRDWVLQYGITANSEGIGNFYGANCSSGNNCGLGLNLTASTYNSTQLSTLGGKGEAHGVLIGTGGSVVGALASFGATATANGATVSGAVVLH